MLLQLTGLGQSDLAGQLGAQQGGAQLTAEKVAQLSHLRTYTEGEGRGGEGREERGGEGGGGREGGREGLRRITDESGRPTLVALSSMRNSVGPFSLFLRPCLLVGPLLGGEASSVGW